MKHAFPPDWEAAPYKEGSSEKENSPRVEIQLSQEETGQVELILRDNGIGLPGGIEIDQMESLGLHLVHVLAVHQLDGELHVSNDPGACFTIRFDTSGDKR